MRFLHLADVHYGKIYGNEYGPGFGALRKRELIAALQKTVEAANENKVDCVLCAGDLLQGEDIGIRELRDLNGVLAGLTCGKWISVAGNHDPLHRNNPYRRMAWVDSFVLAPAGYHTLIMQDVRLHTFSADRKNTDFDLIKHIRLDATRKNVLLAHADAQGSEYLPVDLKELSEMGFDYVALGHIHKRGNPYFGLYYPGSLLPLDRSETGAHGCLLVDLDQEQPEVTFLPISQREYKRISLEVRGLNAQQLTARLAAEMEQAGREHFYDVTLKGCLDPQDHIDLEELKSVLNGEGFWVRFEDETCPDIDWKALLKENEQNLIGEYIGSFGETEDCSEEEKKAILYGIEAMTSARGGT